MSDHFLHPLDAPDDDDTTGVYPPQGGSRLPREPWLRISLIVLVISSLVAFLSGVAASNAPINSAFAILSSTTNRISMLVMLLAFCAILIGYRMPYLKQLWQRYGLDRSLEARSVAIRPPGFVTLVVANLGGFVLAILLVNWWPVIFTVWLLYMSLLITMLIWHTGYLRAYAVGVLTVSVLQIITLPMLSFALRRGLYGMTDERGGFVYMLVVSMLAGLFSATYVALLLRYRANVSERTQLAQIATRRPDSLQP